MAEPRPRRVRPYPLVELPRLLRLQWELQRAAWQHLRPVLEAIRAELPAGLLQDALGGAFAVRSFEPALVPIAGLAARAQGGVAVALERLGPGALRAVLVVDQTLTTLMLQRGPGAELLALLRGLFQGTLVRVGPLLPIEEVEEFLDEHAAAAQALLLDLQVHTGHGDGWARLLCPAELRLSVAPPLGPAATARLLRRAPRLGALPVCLRIEAGYGELPLAEVAALAVGDVLLLDRFGPRPVVGGPVWLRLGRGVFPARLDGEGVTLQEGFQIAYKAPIKEYPMAPPPDPGNHDPDSPPDRAPRAHHGTDAEAPTANDGAEQLLRELPVPVVCEIGRVTLTGQEVLELRPGTVLPVGRPLAGPVDLLVGERLIARGELVDVEGELGVRVTETYDQP